MAFPIPLSAPIAEANVHYLEVGDGETANCPGTASDPEAAAGHLCVYAATEEKALFIPSGTFRYVSGVTLTIFLTEAEGTALGTFAVTAP